MYCSTRQYQGWYPATVAEVRAWRAATGKQRHPRWDRGPRRPDGVLQTGRWHQLDVGGGQVAQTSPDITYTLPAGTNVPAGGYDGIGRDAEKARLENCRGVAHRTNVRQRETNNRDGPAREDLVHVLEDDLAHLVIPSVRSSRSRG